MLPGAGRSSGPSNCVHQSMMSRFAGCHVKIANRSRLLILIGCGGLLSTGISSAQTRESLAGERAAEALKRSLEAEIKEYNLRYGPVRFKAGASLGVSYTDNVFYSHDRSEDVVINPQIG